MTHPKKMEWISALHKAYAATDAALTAIHQIPVGVRQYGERGETAKQVKLLKGIMEDLDALILTINIGESQVSPVFGEILGVVA